MEKLEIESVEVVPLRIPLADTPIHRFGRDAATTRAYGVTAVWVHTKGGPSGFGYCFQTDSGATTAIASVARDSIAPRLVGRDALAPEGIWAALWGSNRSMMRGGVGAWALSAIDTACWDALAKAAGLPLHRVLGGFRSRVPAYGSGGLRDFSDKELLAELDGYRGYGVSAYKFKIGALAATSGQSTDEARIAMLRKEVGDDFTLYADANQAYTPAEAVEVSAMLRHYGIGWFEEPVPADSTDDLAFVAAHSAVPVAAGENAYFRWGFRELVAKGAAAVLQPDVGVCGGVTEFRKVAALAESYNVALASHLAHEISVSLVGASPAGLAVEFADLLPHDFWAAPNEVVDGHLVVPDVPGHGVELADDARRRYAVD